jgi:hypothetical protein
MDKIYFCFLKMEAGNCIEFLAIFCQSIRHDILLDSDFLTVGAVGRQSNATDNLLHGNDFQNISRFRADSEKDRLQQSGTLCICHFQ